MHDPLSVAFEIKYPWRGKPSRFFPKGYRHAFITVWHVDPEVHGDDDSCSVAHRVYRKGSVDRKANRAFMRAVGWHNYITPWRWHFWHYRIQVRPLQDLKRWLFSSCAGCGKRFTWGYAPVSTQWDGGGPRWFRGEKLVYHDGCESNLTKKAIP